MVRKRTLEEWNNLQKKYNEGDIVKGKVYAHYSYGIGINFGELFYGLVNHPHMYKNKPIYGSEDYPRLGTEVQCVIGPFRKNSHEINLSYVSLSMNLIDD